MDEAPIVIDIAKNLSEVKGALLNLARENNSPAVGNTTRMVIDHLDTSYALYNMLLGIIQSQNQQIDEAVESGNVVQFPGKESPDA
jgi:hypothetical protein